MKKYLLEIGCEELPPSAVLIGEGFLKENFQNKFKDFFLYDTPENIKVFATPRRLGIILYNLKEREESKKETIIGPPYKVAVDSEGKFTKAAIGFAKKNNIPIENLQRIETEKGVYIGAVIEKEGKTLEKYIEETVPEIISSIPFPKTMRWNRTNFRFSRPIRWILSLLDSEVVPLEIAGLKSDRFTYLHRFMTKPIGRGEKKEIPSVESYEEALKLGFVIPVFSERREAVETQITGFARSIDAEPVLDDELIDEVTNLLEFPVGILGDFSPEYLVLPEEVIIIVCKHHQRYFNFKKNGKLIPKFLAFSNTSVKDRNVVKEGYEKVLRARLEDALFFYEEDLKKNLDDLFPLLEGILFHEKIGTMLDKVERNGIIAEILADKLGIKELTDIKRANKLSKVDLLTEMVKEFDELQGIMGMYYALKQGEKEEVAKAIYEHYLPKTSDDKLPETETGTVLSIADKIDNLISFFAVGEKPKAGFDPYGLRRSALGIIRILIEKGIDIDLKELISESVRKIGLSSLLRKSLKGSLTEFDFTGLTDEVFDFIVGRFSVYVKGKGFDTDVINAVLSTEESNLYRAYLKIKAVQQLKENPEFEDIMVAFKRVGNIIPENFEESFNETLLSKEEEKELFKEYVQIKKDIDKLIEKREYKKALSELLRLKPYIDRFFDNVMVMVKDEDIKNNRLSLLKKINDLFRKISDFTKINVQGGK